VTFDFLRPRLDRAPRSFGRSAVRATGAVVATSQPLAAEAGVEVLRRGGNAFDAAVATAAVLNVVEPMSTGIGGDAFALCWVAREGRLLALNASGRSPHGLTADLLRRRGFTTVPETGIFSVTVPGAAAGWADLVARLGRRTLADVLAPAIHYAEEGFPLSEVIALSWRSALEKLSAWPPTKATYLVHGRAPEVGEVVRQPNLARTLRWFAADGPERFYRGEAARAIVASSDALGGCFTLKDLADHTSDWVEPISTSYRGVELYECPPNGQGLAALIALNILGGEGLAALGHNSPDYLHLLVEAKKLAFADRDRYVADPEQSPAPLQRLLSKEYAAERRRLIDRGRASAGFPAGIFAPGEDTVYLTVVDAERNCCSFINSLYTGFGSGLVAGETGVCLQNRGACFLLEEGHPNCVGPHKRPLHTIIPALATRNGKPWLSYGVMGGHMQPQGHVQVLLNMVDFGMGPQDAIEAPRFCHFDGPRVALEHPAHEEVGPALTARGHHLLPDPGLYGGGQLIEIDPETGALAAGSDPRKDGAAAGY
jgi:gamma-glutamyltranspeptidase/glutathione hydrolase